MPATAEALRLTDAYRARLLQLRQALVQGATRAWTLGRATELDPAFDAWVAATAGALRAGQRQGALLSDEYLARFVALELGREASRPPLDPDEFAGEDRGGRSLERALAPALFTVKTAIAQGRTRQEASRMGRARAMRTVSTESVDGPRRALLALMGRRDEVQGWRRVASPGACGACLASVTGTVQRTGTPFDIHDHCRCGAEPKVAGAADRLLRPTGRETFMALSAAEQARLFAGRGGEEKAKLIASGEVPMERLVSEVHYAEFPRGITEAPLAALKE